MLAQFINFYQCSMHDACCHVLTDLFHNPVAQEDDYRLYVISRIPTLCMLDRRGLHENFK